MKKRVLFSITALLLDVLVFGQSLENVLNAENMKPASSSFLIKNADDGKIVLQHRAEKAATPASLAKIITTATALEILGGDFRFETCLEYDGKLDKNGILNGNLYIRGGGDPTLGSQFIDNADFLPEWIEAVKKTGIKIIKGNVIADASLCSDEGISPKWNWEDIGNHYATGVYALNVNDNSCTVTLKSGRVGTTAEIVKVQPSIPGLSLLSQVKASSISYDSAYAYGAPLLNERIIRGAIPARRSEFPIRIDMPNPPLYLAQLVTNSLVENGIKINGKAECSFQKNVNPKRLIYSHYSAPLSEIVKEINHRSINLYAECVLLRLAVHEKGQGDAVSGISIIKNFWKSKNIDVSPLFLYDGSGLSSSNAVPAEFLVDVLQYMYAKSANKDIFIASLPVAGESGTVKNLLKGTALEGKVCAKSGTIGGVQSYAGYIVWKDKTYAFALIVNHFSGKRKEIIKHLESVLLSITDLTPDPFPQGEGSNEATDANSTGEGEALNF